jgi:hypothetical protein
VPTRVLIVLALAIAPRVALAQQASAQAEALFRRGKQLVAQGKLAEGCAAFEASQAIEPMATTRINLADCREQNHQLATAWGLYTDLLRELRGKRDAASLHLAKVAGKRAARIEPHLSHLTITAPAGVDVTRNGDRVEPASLGQTLPVDGGRYELVARAPGRVDWTQAITIKDADDARAITVPALAAIPRDAPPPPPAPVVVTAPRARPAPARPAAPGPSHLAAYATLGAGAAAIAGSLVLGELARRRYADAKATCGGDLACEDDAQVARARSLTGEARTRAWLATGAAAAGVVALGIGTYLLVRRPAERRVALAPQLDGALGVVAWGSF